MVDSGETRTTTPVQQKPNDCYAGAHYQSDQSIIEGHSDKKTEGANEEGDERQWREGGRDERSGSEWSETEGWAGGGRVRRVRGGNC